MKKPKVKLALEKETQLAICHYLEAKQYFFWRQNNTPVFDFSTKTYRSMPKYAVKGVPDIIIILPGGKVAFIEVKRKPAKQSPEQVTFQKKVEAHGCTYILAYSLDDVVLGGL